MNTKNLLIALAVVLVAGGVLAYVTDSIPDGGTVACTQEAKICPDGSAVGREGPNCEFVACPDTTGYGTIKGRVTLSPTCPVETLPPDPSCAPQPYQTIVSIQDVSGEIVASMSTDENGYYSIRVKPGTYDVVASSGNPLPLCKNGAHITVQSDDVQEMDISTDISCDTGIR